MNLIQRLELLLNQTRLEILNNEQIKFNFPQLNGFTDLILITETHFICIKDYWTLNNLNENIINSYNTGSLNININLNKKFIFILLTKKYNQKIFNVGNIFILSAINKNMLLNELSNLLYLNKIFFYDSDYDTIIL